LGKKQDIKLQRTNKGELNIQASTVRFNQKTLDELIRKGVQAALKNSGGGGGGGNTGNLKQELDMLRTQLDATKCANKQDGSKIASSSTTLTCYGGVAYAIYDTDKNRGNTFQVKDIKDLRKRCASLGLKAVRVKSAFQIHQHLRPLVQKAGYNLKLGSGIPLGYDDGLNNDYQALDDSSVHVQHIFNTLRSRWGYTGDYYTDQTGGKQHLAGFGWANSPTDAGIEDWGFQVFFCGGTFGCASLVVFLVA